MSRNLTESERVGCLEALAVVERLLTGGGVDESRPVERVEPVEVDPFVAPLGEEPAFQRNRNRVMLDLETMGTRPGCAIVAIGAVRFDDEGEVASFYRRVDLEDAVRCGLSMDAETVKWWMGQADGVRAEWIGKGVGLENALLGFKHWLGEVDELWGCGADFDNAILGAAYEAVGLPVPWNFRANRCYRTVKALAPGLRVEREGYHHHALDDARHQVRHLLAIFNS